MQTRAVQDALAGWSSCMGAKGYPARDPADAHAKYDAPDRSTVAPAMAEAECSKSAALVATWQAEEQRIQLELIERNAARLATIKERLDEVAARSADITGAGF